MLANLLLDNPSRTRAICKAPNDLSHSRNYRSRAHPSRTEFSRNSDPVSDIRRTRQTPHPPGTASTVTKQVTIFTAISLLLQRSRNKFVKTRYSSTAKLISDPKSLESADEQPLIISQHNSRSRAYHWTGQLWNRSKSPEIPLEHCTQNTNKTTTKNLNFSFFVLRNRSD